MSKRMDLVRQHYRSTSKGGIGIPEKFWTDDFVWDVPRPRDMPGSGRVKGRQGAIASLRSATKGWDKLAIIADEIYEEKNRVVVMGHIDVRQNGKSVTAPVVHIWGFRPREAKANSLISVCFYHNLKKLRPRS